jgi:hypothetical protein
MYAAHTTVEPYTSTVSIVYRNANVDSNLMSIIKAKMKNDLKQVSRTSNILKLALDLPSFHLSGNESSNKDSHFSC